MCTKLVLAIALAGSAQAFPTYDYNALLSFERNPLGGLPGGAAGSGNQFAQAGNVCLATSFDTSTDQFPADASDYVYVAATGAESCNEVSVNAQVRLATKMSAMYITQNAREDYLADLKNFEATQGTAATRSIVAVLQMDGRDYVEPATTYEGMVTAKAATAFYDGATGVPLLTAACTAAAATAAGDTTRRLCGATHNAVPGARAFGAISLTTPVSGSETNNTAVFAYPGAGTTGLGLGRNYVKRAAGAINNYAITATLPVATASAPVAASMDQRDVQACTARITRTTAAGSGTCSAGDHTYAAGEVKMALFGSIGGAAAADPLNGEYGQGEVGTKHLVARTELNVANGGDAVITFNGGTSLADLGTASVKSMTVAYDGHAQVVTFPTYYNVGRFTTEADSVAKASGVAQADYTPVYSPLGWWSADALAAVGGGNVANGDRFQLNSKHSYTRTDGAVKVTAASQGSGNDVLLYVDYVMPYFRNDNIVDTLNQHNGLNGGERYFTAESKIVYYPVWPAATATIVGVERSLDTAWVLLGGFLVLFMQAGFALLEVGSVSVRNTQNILLKIVGSPTVAAIMFWTVGYSFAYGSDCESGYHSFFFGTECWWFMSGEIEAGTASTYTGGLWYATWFYQFAYAAICSTIVSGAVAERIVFKVYVVIVVVLTGFIYPVVVHWGWSADGWASAHRTLGEAKLFDVGAIDTAGAGVVHMVGGLVALVTAYMIGPRHGRFVKHFKVDGRTYAKPSEQPLLEETTAEWMEIVDADTASGEEWRTVSSKKTKQLKSMEHKGTLEDFVWKANPFPSQSPTFQVLGCLILWFGWYGFTCVSQMGLSGNRSGDVGKIAVTTTIAAAGGALTTGLLTYILDDVQDMASMAIGLLVGLVSIASAVADVEPWAALCIGIIGSFVYVGAVRFLDLIRVDDVTHAIPVHLFCGFWGMIATGLFASPSSGDGTSGACGFFYIDAHGCSTAGKQLLAQFIFSMFIIAWTAVTTAVLLFLTKFILSSCCGRCLDSDGVKQGWYLGKDGHSTPLAHDRATQMYGAAVQAGSLMDTMSESMSMTVTKRSAVVGQSIVGGEQP